MKRRTGFRLLAQSGRLMRALVENSPECVKLLGAEGRLLQMNPAGLAMLEAASLAEVQRRPLLEFVVPADRAAFVALHRRVMEGGSGMLEFEVEGLKGTRRRLATHAVPFAGVDGSPMLLGITRDVTEGRRATQALRASEQRLRMLVGSSPLAIYTRDRDGLLTSWNPAAEKMYGWAASEVLGRPLPSVPDAARADSDRLRHRLLAGEEMITKEVERRRKDGSIIFVDAFLAPLRDSAGRTEGIIAVAADVTERKLAEERLRESEERFRSLSALSADWYWEQDERFRFVDTGDDPHNPVRADDIGKTRWEIASAELSQAQWDAHRAILEQHLPFRDFEYGRTSRDSVWRYVSVSGVPIFDASGAFRGYRGTGRDLTESRRAEARIRRLNRVYAVLSGINALIVRVRERDELYRGACRIAVEHGGFPIAWIGEVDREAMQVRLAASEGADERLFRAIRMTLREDAPEGLGVVGEAVRTRRPVISNATRDDQRITGKGIAAGDEGSLAVLPLIVGAEAVGVLVLHSAMAGFFDAEEMTLLRELAADIAFALDHIEQAKRLDYLAYYDSLTGLANRRLFEERLVSHLRATGEARSKSALLLLNVERFKAVNDSLGRPAGDELLRQLGERLSRAAGAASIARIGGDQFAVLLASVKGRSEVARGAERIWRQCFSGPIRAEGQDLRVSAKVGMALYPNDGAGAEALFANAEAALKEARASGQRFHFHTHALTASVASQLALESRLRQALERDEFVLHYQPKIDTATRAIVGMEALIRWASPDLGLVPPVQFIPLLEETGLILEVGSWALRRAALDHRAWTERRLTPPRVAVNVSPIQLRQHDFVGLVERAIMEGVAPVGIDLEITESLIMADIDEGNAKLRRVRGLGVRIAIDDFGTGYSSLAYLAKLPVHSLKIDRSFIVGMLADAHTMALVQTIVSLAHSLHLRVIAEGVDAEEQAAVLHRLGCDEMQGYLFSKPVPFEQMTALLRDAPRPA